MCDYKSYSKEELSRHGIEVHMRHWTSLQVVMTREIIADREQVCQLVNSYIPNRSVYRMMYVFITVMCGEIRSATV